MFSVMSVILSSRAPIPRCTGITQEGEPTFCAAGMRTMWKWAVCLGMLIEGRLVENENSKPVSCL